MSYIVGRRKVSVARVVLVKDSSDIIINDRLHSEYFSREIDRMTIAQPLSIAGLYGKIGVKCLVNGGGTTGQAQAIRLAVARALLNSDEGLRSKLRSRGYLTRDSRMVESKKYGRRKSRRSFQFAKR